MRAVELAQIDSEMAGLQPAENTRIRLERMPRQVAQSMALRRETASEERLVRQPTKGHGPSCSPISGKSSLCANFLSRQKHEKQLRLSISIHQ